MKGTDMKKIGSVICFSVLVLLLFVTPVMSSDDWVEYDKNEDGSILLYNKGSIVKSGGKNVVQVWKKWIFSDEEREKTLKIVNNTEGWNKLSYGISLDQIDCKNMKLQILSITLYDTDGKVLISGNPDKTNGEYIVPGSNGDTLRKTVCK